METMIISTARGYTQQFCVECPETNLDLRAHLEQSLDYLEITEQVLGEVCDACGRGIREVPAYLRLYLLKPELRIVLAAEIPACSALEARLLLHAAIDPTELLWRVQQRIGADLEEGDLLSDPGSLTYRVAEPQVLPPPRDTWVTALPVKPVPVASPPQTLADLYALAPVQELLARFEQAGLSERYTGSFETCLLLHHLLTQANIHHGMMQGYLSQMEGAAHPHVWMDLSPSLGSGWMVDYCARDRFGQEAPRGLFTRKEYPHFAYSGAQSPLPLSPPQSLLQDMEEALRELALA